MEAKEVMYMKGYKKLLLIAMSAMALVVAGCGGTDTDKKMRKLLSLKQLPYRQRPVYRLPLMN